MFIADSMQFDIDLFYCGNQINHFNHTSLCLHLVSTGFNSNSGTNEVYIVFDSRFFTNYMLN